MTPLLRPVTRMKCSMPAARASSTTYWMIGRTVYLSRGYQREWLDGSAAGDGYVSDSVQVTLRPQR